MGGGDGIPYSYYWHIENISTIAAEYLCSVRSSSRSTFIHSRNLLYRKVSKTSKRGILSIIAEYIGNISRIVGCTVNLRKKHFYLWLGVQSHLTKKWWGRGIFTLQVPLGTHPPLCKDVFTPKYQVQYNIIQT